MLQLPHIRTNTLLLLGKHSASDKKGSEILTHHAVSHKHGTHT